MIYQPDPINTTTVILTMEYLELARSLASNCHDVWAREQFAQGWCYAPQFDPDQKHDPHLVPYVNLPDAVQEAQWGAIADILKTLLALGYRLEPQDAIRSETTLDDRHVNLILQGLKNSTNVNLTHLLDLRRETIRLNPRTPDLYHMLGHSILRLGEPLMAYDVLAEGLKQFPNDLKLQQFLALALARSGSTVAANTLLQTLVQAGHQDEETLGLLARTHKDLWVQAIDPKIQEYHLRLAAERYQQAYHLTDSVWTGINAATLSMVMGQVDHAKALAKQVQASCLEQLHPDATSTGTDYWLLATLGEAALILGDWSQAEDFYQQAVAVGQGRFGDLSSSRRNAMLLLQNLGGDVDRVKRLFQIPRVVVFCGHMIDRPSRPHPRFPPSLESTVYQQIRDRLIRLDARLGYASAACGSDILFLEAIRELQGELHIVLPYNREQFLQESVNVIPGANWQERCERLLEQATEVIVASSQKLQENDVVYEYSNRLLHGLAKMRAEQLGTELVPLTVWNGQPGDGLGGTASTVAHWQQWSDHVEIIPLETLLHQTSLVLPSPRPDPPLAMSVPASPEQTSSIYVERQIRALLFADVVNYSRLAEVQYLPFVEHFLGAIADLSAQSNYNPLMKNTWGDAIYFVFPSVLQAGRFALDLCDRVQAIDWSTRGLPADLNLRIALHAGPVDRNVDPITGQVNYIGAHVNHTARIEPITPPGKVYASQAFAAMTASEGLTEFTCNYVGQMPWAKHYGTFPTYHVHRASILPA